MDQSAKYSGMAGCESAVCMGWRISELNLTYFVFVGLMFLIISFRFCFLSFVITRIE
jgi:hypothetical protein